MTQRGNHYSEGQSAQKKSKKGIVLIAVLAAFLLVAGTAAVMFMRPFSGGDTEDTRETVFIEQPTEMVQQGDKIEIRDAELGVIEIEAVPGFAKNMYDNDNFSYDENGYKIYTINGEKASCEGIDLSEYQGEVDFEQVKESGIDYVILRVGGRAYGDEGQLYPDDMFETYYNDAKAAGLGVGAYFFSQAASVEDGIEEAEFTLSKIKGLEMDYPIVFDWEPIIEDEARTDNVTGEVLTDAAIAFMETIRAAGFEPMWYTNTSLLYYKYELEKLKDYDLWIADYAEYPSAYYHFTMWQYTHTSSVPGIEGEVDINVCFKNY